jgi:hypothetical protein
MRKEYVQKYEKWLSGMLLLALILLVLSLLQFSTPNLVGNDGYYHIKIAELMRIESLKPDFPWLPLTILNPGEFSDHHFLFHVLMILFTLGDLVQGAKWASIIFASFAFMCVWWLLRNQRVPYAGLWTLGLLAISEAFLYRMSMPRTQSLSLALLVLGLNFMLQKKYGYLLPLSFLFVWLYDAFPLMVVIAGIYVISLWLVEKELHLQPLVFVLLGVTFGLLINPYFPDNIIFGARHVIPKVLGEADVRVGNEWYPYETDQLLENSPLGLLVFLAGVVALGLRNERMDTRTAVTLFISIFFGLMLFQSRRFIEYYPPFALIFCAMACSPLISNPWRSYIERIQGDRREKDVGEVSSGWKIADWLPGFLLLVILSSGIFYTGRAARENLSDTRPAGLYSGASQWLVENTPRGTRVFQTDWDDFPRLLFHNSWNTYLIGLDPTFMQIKDPDLFEQWVAITRGEADFPAQDIFYDFAAQYILTDLKHKDFINRAGEDAEIVEVYRDKEAIVYQVQLLAD